MITMSLFHRNGGNKLAMGKINWDYKREKLLIVVTFHAVQFTMPIN
jgi:hypothetical protein